MFCRANNRKKKIGVFCRLIVLCSILVILLSGCNISQDLFHKESATQTSSYDNEIISATIYSLTSNTFDEKADAFIDSLYDISLFSENPYYELNGNVPFFTSSEKTITTLEYYSELDSLGRCGVAFVCIGKETMPTEERGEIGQIKPSGWHTIKYDIVEGKYLYNRCHLVGYQLSGENANPRNLITGTRFLNNDGMLPFENKVAEYVQNTGNHVIYRVTPVFEDSNLLAYGVIIEAFSVEDNGKGICFNVFCYNAQPGISINYSTGESVALDTQADITKSQNESNYIVNINTNKFHQPNCSSVSSIKAKNRIDYFGMRDTLVSKGYQPCKKCNP